MTAAACLWLGLFPLLQRGTYATMTKDKWTFMLLLTGITFFCFVIDLFSKRISKPKKLPLVAGGILLFWMLLSVLTSPYQDVSWWVGAGRREGLVSQLCYLSLFLMFSCSRVKHTPVLYAAGIGEVIFLIIALLQRAGGNPLGLYPTGYSYSNAPLFQSTIGHMDMGAGYLLILEGLFLPAFIKATKDMISQVQQKKAQKETEQTKTAKAEKQQTRQKTTHFLLMLLFLAVDLFLVFTIDVRFAILMTAVFFIWTAVRFLPKKYRLPVLILLIVAALLFAWFYTGSISTLQELHEVLHGNLQFTYGSGRIGVWTYSLKLLGQKEYLLTGTGVDTFVLRFNTFLQSWYAEHPEAERLAEHFDSPHNEYLAMLLNCGIPALLCFLILVIGGCFGAENWRDGVFCYGIQALLSFSVCIIAPMFWAVLGMAYSKQSQIKTEET